MTGLVVPLLASGSSTVTVNITKVAAFFYFHFVVSSYRFLNIHAHISLSFYRLVITPCNPTKWYQ